MLITRVLNLGCGLDKYGTDRIDFTQTPGTTLVWDLEKGIPFDDGTFDKVYSKSLLEHLSNVGFHLKECYRVLNVAGSIEVITDNASCWRYYIFGTHTGRYEVKHPGDRHYCIFTKKHLLNHFENAGFRNIHVEYVKTDTIGKWLDLFTFQHPRIRVTATK